MVHPLRKVREAGGGTAEFAALLAPDVVFNSPIHSQPAKGRDLVTQIMVAAVAVREGHYVGEFVQGDITVLLWRGMIQGHDIESMETLRCDSKGLIVERTVAMRPFPAVLLFRQAFYDRMKDELDPAYFSLPQDSKLDGAG